MEAGISSQWPFLLMDRTPQKTYPFLTYSRRDGTAVLPCLGHLATTHSIMQLPSREV